MSASQINNCVMKIEFKAITRLGEEIISNSIIQKEINNELFIYLNIKGYWKLINNDTLIIKQFHNV
jgi:hypothetical protein